LQTIFRITQVVAEMAWKEHLDNAKKVCQTVTINHITSPANKSNVESSTDNNLNVKSKSIISKWVRADNDNENENENDKNKNKEAKELSTVSFDTTNLYNYHLAEHEDSKIELQYFFVCDLLQLSFVCTLQ
ncbi:39406_t:CDS:2, partial [Gigaspora margarita]